MKKFLFAFIVLFPCIFTSAVPSRAAASLIAALKAHDKGAVHKLLLAHVDPNQFSASGITPLHYAAYTGIFSLVKLLLEAKADVNARTLSNKEFNFGLLLSNSNSKATPLMLGSYAGSYAIVEAILAIKAEHEIESCVNAVDSDQQNALTYTILGDPHWPQSLSDERKKIIKLLLAHGCNPLLADNNGLTPRYYYARTLETDDYGDTRVVDTDPLYNDMA